MRILKGKFARNRRGHQIHAQTLVCERQQVPSGGVLLGYARVSKGDEQSNAVQAKALRAAGCRRIFEEAASGGRWDRPELHRPQTSAKAGRLREKLVRGGPARARAISLVQRRRVSRA